MKSFSVQSTALILGAVTFIQAYPQGYGGGGGGRGSGGSKGSNCRLESFTTYEEVYDDVCETKYE